MPAGSWPRRSTAISDSDPVVLALPRGGVPVGFEVAKALGAPLDVLIVRKIGAPGHAELGIGAVVDGGRAASRAERGDRPAGQAVRRLYRRGEAAPAGRDRAPAAALSRRPAAIPVEGRIAIVVDDGIATGGTVRAALRGSRASVRRGWCWRCRWRRPTASTNWPAIATTSSAWRRPSRFMRSGRITATSPRPRTTR